MNSFLMKMAFHSFHPLSEARCSLLQSNRQQWRLMSDCVVTDDQYSRKKTLQLWDESLKFVTGTNPPVHSSIHHLPPLPLQGHGARGRCRRLTISQSTQRQPFTHTFKPTVRGECPINLSRSFKILWCKICFIWNAWRAELFFFFYVTTVQPALWPPVM